MTTTSIPGTPIGSASKCDNATDYCKADRNVKHSNATGPAMANRFPVALPGKAA